MTRGQWIALDVLAVAFMVLIGHGQMRATTRSTAGVPLSVGMTLVGLLVVLNAAPIVFRRVWPVPVLAWTLLMTVVIALARVPVGPFLPMAFALYTVAATRPRRVALRALAASQLVVVMVVVMFGYLPTGPKIIANGIANVLVIGASWAIGYSVHRAREYGAGLTQQAMQAERLRIARELHDVVAHNMSVIAVQAGMGHFVIDSDPAEAKAALAAIETTSRAALRELRGMLGVLRADTDDVAARYGPVPGLGDLDRLLARTADAGVAVEVEVRGEPRPLPSGVDTSAYRIVQEALTNVVRHARTDRARLHLRFGVEDVAVEVTDRGAGRGVPAGAGGHGLVGMRERVAIYGGTFDAGPLPGGGFRVAASLPVGGGR
jgi:signal transduction histidine kinase